MFLFTFAGCRLRRCSDWTRSPPSRCTDATATTATKGRSRSPRAAYSRVSPRARRAGAHSCGPKRVTESWAIWSFWKEPPRQSRRRWNSRPSHDVATACSRRSTRRCARASASGARCTCGATGSRTRSTARRFRRRWRLCARCNRPRSGRFLTRVWRNPGARSRRRT